MSKLNKFKSALISGAMAVSAVVSPLAAALTPSLTVNAAGSDNYAKLLQYSLYFYDANMCGKVNSAFSWRSDCHTGDDVPGGYHDAGDHAMFGLPQGYTAATLGWAYFEFKDAFDATGQTAHFKTVMNHFNDFFKKSTKMSGGTVTSLLYQKGDGDTDHAFWGAPEAQEQQQGKRKQFWADGNVSDVAAEYAASLALSYLNFGNEEDLSYAKALYDFSTKSNSNSKTLDGHQGFYNSDSFQDDQAFAAGFLYMATKDQKYLNDCRSKQAKYQGWCHSWNNVNLGSAAVLAEIDGDWSAVTGWMSGKVGNGYCFLDKWGSARLNASMQMTALIATKYGGANWSEWAKGQMNYILGDNPANTCFVCGFADNSAKNAHHRAASGYTSYNEFPTGEGTFAQYGSNGHILTGALVGGPSDAGGTYQDNMNDYVCNEVAVDYNAGLVGAAAGLYYFYMTGTPDSNVNGIGTVSNVPVSTTQHTTSNGQTTQTTTKSSQQTSQTTATSQQGGSGTVLMPSDMKVGTEKGDDGKINNYAEFSPKGAKKATLYLTVKSNDTEVSGGFGTWTGEWEQVNFEGVKVGADKTVAIDYTIPSNVGATVKAMVFWPHGDDVVIDKIVLDGGSSATTANTTAKTTTNTTKTTATTKTTQQTTVAGSGNDVVLTPSDMKVGTEKGDDGKINNYAEFSPKGAKSATLYLTVKSNDTEVSGGFGTWTGEWEQVNFEGVKVGSDKTVAIDYTIPSNVGATVKAMVFWPHGDDVVIDKIVLHTDGSSATTTKTTTKTTTTTTTTKTTTTTTKTTTQGSQGSILYGDANDDGRVNLADAVSILQYLANSSKYPLSAQGLKNADVDGQGGVSAMDAMAIQRLDAGSISKLPL